MACFSRSGGFASLIPACALLLLPSTVRAQASAADKAAAEALFDHGVRLMKQEQYSDACPKLEESDRIDPAVGTLLYLAECYERTGRTASAWATFREAASLATNSGQADRARVASARAQTLEGKLSRLSIELAPDVAKIPGVIVRRGTQRLEPSLLGTPLPVDPGEYRIEVTAPGYETWITPIKVEAGGATASVRVPALVKAATPAPGAETAPPPALGSPVTGTSLPSDRPATLDASSPGLSGQQVFGIALGGVGIVGLGLGSYFGLRAISTNDDAEPHCPNSGFCNDEKGLSLTEDAKKQAGISNIAFAAGGVLLGVGAVLFLTGGADTSERVALVPSVAPGTAAANVVGRF